MKIYTLRDPADENNPFYWAEITAGDSIGDYLPISTTDSEVCTPAAVNGLSGQDETGMRPLVYVESYLRRIGAQLVEDR